MLRRLGVAISFIALVGIWQPTGIYANDPSTSPSPGPSEGPSGTTSVLLAGEEPGRAVLMAYGAGSYRYKVVSQGAQSGFESPGFDDVAGGFANGTAAFADDTCSGPYATSWTGNTDILLRRQISVPPGAHDVQISVAIDNDIQVFWNGTDISGGLVASEGCATYDEYTFTVPDALLQSGINLLAARGRERGLSQRIDLKVTAAVALTRPPCAEEDTSTTLDPWAPDGRVTIVYDPRFVVDPSRPGAVDEADQVAHYLQTEAEAALATYDSLGFPTPPGITFKVTCAIDPIDVPPLPPIPVDAPAMTRGPGQVEIRANEVERAFADAVRGGFQPGPWSEPSAYWKQELIQHEIFHNVQWETGSLVLREVGGDITWVESPAELATDLFPAADDIPSTEYLTQLTKLAESTKRSFDTHLRETQRPYQYASVLQYWAERYGPQSEPNLEARVVDYLNALIRAPFPFGIPGYIQGDGELAAFGATLDYDYASGSYDASDYGSLEHGYERGLNALRDYYAANLALGAPNVAQQAGGRYVIWDAVTGHGYPPGITPAGGVAAYQGINTEGDLDLTIGPDTVTRTLEPTEAEAFILQLPPGTTDVELTVSVDPMGDADSKAAPRLGFVRFGDDGSVAMDPVLMPTGPMPGQSRSYSVGMTNFSSLGLVVVGGNRPVTYTVAANTITGTPAISIDDATTANPKRVADARESLFLRVTPTIDGFMPTTLDRGSFTVRLNGVNANVVHAYRYGGSYTLEANIPDTLGAGTYDITAEYAGATSPAVADGLVIDDTLPPHNVPVYSTNYASVAQGNTVNDTVLVSSDTDEVAFDLQWLGSDFDLMLTAPSGRIITEATSDPDVVIEQTANSVRITVSGPEAGDWQVAATGSDVPQPEPLDLAVAEAGTPIQASLLLPTGFAAGDGLPIAVGVTDQVLSVGDASVAAEVTDPAGATRIYPLFDDGGHGDAGADDGLYGAEVWSTAQPGSYNVHVIVEGLDANGDPFRREADGSVVAGQMMDTDGDGVRDAAEVRFGTNPTDPTDGLADLDGDGVGLRDELAAGTSPDSVDTDGGGEVDGSELAAGRDPLLASDDQATASPSMQASAEDGSAVYLDVSTVTSAGNVHLWRSDGSQTTDMGLFSGAGVSFTDGPLPAGEYTYRAVGISPSGAESVPLLVGPLHVADDVTPPDFGLIVNGGIWDVQSTTITIGFDSLSEAPLEMRAAETADALELAPWEPYAQSSTVEVEATEGKHSIFAQVRDAAGHPSSVREGFIYLVDETPPSSNIDPLPPLITEIPATISFTAVDDISGIDSVELWWRFRQTAGGAWTPWALAASQSTSPFSFDFSPGSGYYEVYSIATDVAGNRELAPATADVAVEVPDASPVWAWGSNLNLQLGSVTSETCSYGYACSTTPIQARGLANVVAVDAGAQHSVALLQDGTVWAWGDNDYGQLGNGGGPDSATPVQVPGLSDVVKVAAGAYVTLALKSDGTVWAWGHQQGGLGDGTSVTPRLSPIQVSGLGNVVDIAAGRAHSLAVRGDGTVWAWGSNSHGELGDNSTKTRTAPVQTQNVANAASVSAGDWHSFAIESDGTLWAWGSNYNGQLGIGNTRDQKRPVEVTALTSVITVAGADGHSLAVRSDGTVWGWGWNNYGQVGDGTGMQRTTPVQALNVADAIAVDGGSWWSMALTTDGSVWGWGYAGDGQLDSGSLSPHAPAQVAVSLPPVTSIAAGDWHAVVMLADP